MNHSSYSAGSKVKLISTGECGVVINSWQNYEMNCLEYYVAFFGDEFPNGKPNEIPYILKYLHLSLEAVL